MVEIANIVDGHSLDAWLEKNGSYEVAVTIVHRAAMRLAPKAWNRLLVKEENTRLALRMIRQLIVSGVAAQGERHDILKAADSAATATASIGYDSEEYAAALAADFAVSKYNIASLDLAISGKNWSAIQADCEVLLDGKNLIQEELWVGEANRLEAEWMAVKKGVSKRSIEETSPYRNTNIDWSFWIDWYQRALDGTEERWDMLTAIALLPSEIWEGEPDVLMHEIYAIVEQHKLSETEQGEAIALEVFRATLFDFSYDQLTHVMRAVPLDSDWKQLEDPDLLAPFLLEADELREDIELFCQALTAEGAAMQGAGTVQTYLNAVLKELERAKEVETLRVGKLIEYGRMIDAARSSEEVKREFGILGTALEDNAKKLLDLMRTHFARTLSRFADLRDIEIEEGLSPWEVLQGFRDLIGLVKKGGPERPPLEAEDAAVLDDILESVDRQMRAMDGNSDPDTKASLRREVNFELAKLGATIAIYRERAVGAEAGLAKGADIALKWHKRGIGIGAIVSKLKDAM